MLSTMETDLNVNQKWIRIKKAIKDTTKATITKMSRTPEDNIWYNEVFVKTVEERKKR